MWPTLVIVLSPLVDDNPGMVKGVEPVLIQALIPELAIEAFDECILCRLARLNQF